MMVLSRAHQPYAVLLYHAPSRQDGSAIARWGGSRWGLSHRPKRAVTCPGVRGCLSAAGGRSRGSTGWNSRARLFASDMYVCSMLIHTATSSSDLLEPTRRNSALLCPRILHAASAGSSRGILPLPLHLGPDGDMRHEASKCTLARRASTENMI